VIQEGAAVRDDRLAVARLDVGPLEKTDAIEFDVVLGPRRLLVGAQGLVQRRRDAEVERAALIHHRRRQLCQRVMREERLAVGRERQHRLDAGELPRRPGSGEPDHRVTAQRMPGEREAGQIRARVVRQRVDEMPDIVGPIAIIRIAPFFRLPERRPRHVFPARFAAGTRRVAMTGATTR
jgi:hypothetical protein